MPRPRSAPDLHLLSKVSSLYYLRDQTQLQIAERLRISRPTVSRLLAEAKAQGIVQITVAPPRGLHTELEARLEELFDLREAQVIPVEAQQPADVLRRQLGAAGAAYLTRTLEPGERVGLAWGTTLNAMVDAVPPTPTSRVRVVQTLGGVGRPDAEAYAASLVRRLAQLLGATAVPLPAPGIVASTAVRDALCADPHVRAALDQLDALDTVYVGIGSLESNSVLADGRSLPPSTRAELVAAGAVSDIALRFFDAGGAPVRSSLDERLLGITIPQLRKAARVVAVAGGRDKVDAIHSALRTKVVTVLVTDHATAQALVARGAAAA
jgi:DNA-binding transcriptional regulator LsrR (DeoR family)